MSSNPISNLNSRQDDVFSLDDNNKPGIRARHTANNSGLSLHNAGSQSSVNNLEDAFSRQFSQNAAAKDSFHKLMRQTFTQIADPETSGSAANYNYDKAEALRQQALEGDLSWLPEVEVLSNAEFSKAQLNEGAPSSATPLGAFGDNTIFLNESVLSDPKLALRVYSEEAGHALDKVLNQDVDSAGDEGALFSKLLMNKPLSAQQIQALKAENDQGVLGNTDVEFFGGGFFSGAGDFFSDPGGSIGGVIDAITPDFISNPIDINIPDTNIGNIPSLTLDPAIITPDFNFTTPIDINIPDTNIGNIPGLTLDPAIITPDFNFSDEFDLGIPTSIPGLDDLSDAINKVLPTGEELFPSLSNTVNNILEPTNSTSMFGQEDLSNPFNFSDEGSFHVAGLPSTLGLGIDTFTLGNKAAEVLSDTFAVGSRTIATGLSLLTYSPSAGPDTNIYNLEDALLPDVRVSFNPAEVRGNIQRLNNGDWESTGVFVTPTTFNDKGEPTSFAQLTPDQIDVLQQPSPFPGDPLPPFGPTSLPADPQLGTDTGGNQTPDIDNGPLVNPIPDDIPDNSVLNNITIGSNDNGPGIWSDVYTPTRGADYQELVTGAPRHTEYVVPAPHTDSGEIKFDGWFPGSNTLVDAKDWEVEGGWPPLDRPFGIDDTVDVAQKQIEASRQIGASIEWHFPTQEKANEVENILLDRGIEGITFVVTPK